MKDLKVIKVSQDGVLFDNGVRLDSHHDQDCCEWHYLDYEHLTLDDFDGLLFDLSNDDFFRRIDGYGIELVPTNGHSVKIPGYGTNNGYYSDKLDLCLYKDGNTIKTYDITECQDVKD